MKRVLALSLISIMLAGCGSTKATRTHRSRDRGGTGAVRGAAIAGTPGALVGGLGRRSRPRVRAAASVIGAFSPLSPGRGNRMV